MTRLFMIFSFSVFKALVSLSARNTVVLSKVNTVNKSVQTKVIKSLAA